MTSSSSISVEKKPSPSITLRRVARVESSDNNDLKSKIESAKQQYAQITQMAEQPRKDETVGYQLSELQRLSHENLFCAEAALKDGKRDDVLRHLTNIETAARAARGYEKM